MHCSAQGVLVVLRYVVCARKDASIDAGLKQLFPLVPFVPSGQRRKRLQQCLAS